MIAKRQTATKRKVTNKTKNTIKEKIAETMSFMRVCTPIILAVLVSL